MDDTTTTSNERISSPTPTPTPTNDDIEAVIQMATAAAQNDPRALPLRDTRTQLFVANLPYRVRWQDLKDLFRRAGTVLRADVSLGPDNRSRGYGTVLLATAEDAGRAVDMFSGYSWQGRILEVRADRVRDFDQPFPPEEELFTSPVGRNLFVGNLPFHVQWQDLKDLFRQAGTIVRADVALGPDGRSRGFGTVVFATEKDARRAVGMFSGYEYNGRTLKVHYDKFSPAGFDPSNPNASSHFDLGGGGGGGFDMALLSSLGLGGASSSSASSAFDLHQARLGLGLGLGQQQHQSPLGGLGGVGVGGLSQQQQSQLGGGAGLGLGSSNSVFDIGADYDYTLSAAAQQQQQQQQQQLRHRVSQQQLRHQQLFGDLEFESPSSSSLGAGAGAGYLHPHPNTHAHAHAHAQQGSPQPPSLLQQLEQQHRQQQQQQQGSSPQQTSLLQQLQMQAQALSLGASPALSAASVSSASSPLVKEKESSVGSLLGQSPIPGSLQSPIAPSLARVEGGGGVRGGAGAGGQDQAHERASLPTPPSSAGSPQTSYATVARATSPVRVAGAGAGSSVTSTSTSVVGAGASATSAGAGASGSPSVSASGSSSGAGTITTTTRPTSAGTSTKRSPTSPHAPAGGHHRGPGPIALPPPPLSALPAAGVGVGVGAGASASTSTAGVASSAVNPNAHPHPANAYAHHVLNNNNGHNGNGNGGGNGNGNGNGAVHPAFAPSAYVLTPQGLPPITPSMPPFSFLPMPSPQQHMAAQAQAQGYFGMMGGGGMTPTGAHFLNMTPLATPTSPHFPAYVLAAPPPGPVGPNGVAVNGMGGGAMMGMAMGAGGVLGLGPPSALSPGAFWGRAGEGTVYGAPVGQPPPHMVPQQHSPMMHPHAHAHGQHSPYVAGPYGATGGSPGFFGMHAMQEPKGYFDFPPAWGAAGPGTGAGAGAGGVEKEIMRDAPFEKENESVQEREGPASPDREQDDAKTDAGEAAAEHAQERLDEQGQGQGQGQGKQRRHSSDPPPTPGLSLTAGLLREGKRGPPPPLRLPSNTGSTGSAG